MEVYLPFERPLSVPRDKFVAGKYVLPSSNDLSTRADHQQLNATFDFSNDETVEHVQNVDDEEARINRQRVQLSYSFGMLQVVTPTPAFVIKTKRMDKTKVFVNVCSHDLVPYNGDDESDSTKLIYMLVGAPIEHNSEKDSNYCVVYDVVVHPDEIGSSVASSSGMVNSRVSAFNDHIIHLRYLITAL